MRTGHPAAFLKGRVASGRAFTLVEILAATALLIVVASQSFVLMASARQLTGKPTHRTEAIHVAGETLETLRDYVTALPDRENPPGTFVYRLLGDRSPLRYALLQISPDHIHALPPGYFRDTLQGTRNYVVTNVDVDTTFNSDGVAGPGDDADYKKVTVTVTWIEPR